MVSLRCQSLVRSELKNIGIHFAKMTSGVIEFETKLTILQMNSMKNVLMKQGIQIIDPKNSIIVEGIMNQIVRLIWEERNVPPSNYLEVLCQKFMVNENYIATLITELFGIDFNLYILCNRIERTKELLLYRSMSLEEIAEELQFLNATEFSKKFKHVTGLSPKYYQRIQEKKRLLISKNSITD